MSPSARGLPRPGVAAVGRGGMVWLGVVLAAFTLAAILPLLWQRYVETKLVDRSEEQLVHILHSLNSQHMKRVSWEEQQQAASHRLVTAHYPWLLERATAIPHPHIQTGSIVPYADGDVLIFTHQHRSAGSPLVNCLRRHAENHSLALAPVLGSDEQHGQQQSITAAQTYDVHAGKFTFGLCDSYSSRTCSYFSLFREPMARAISSYEYCKTALSDEMCMVVNANQVSLRQWLLHQGSLSLVQLVSSPSWCQQPLPANMTEDEDEEAAPMLLKPQDAPCWYKQKLHLDAIDQVSRQQLTDYVVQHLHKWFHVVGLVEDFETSMHMFENAYRIPFTSCGRSHVAVSSDINDNRANRKRRRTVADDDYDNDPEMLLYDYEVQQALDADMRIYKRAHQIFHIQKQVQFNDLTVKVHK